MNIRASRKVCKREHPAKASSATMGGRAETDVLLSRLRFTMDAPANEDLKSIATAVLRKRAGPSTNPEKMLLAIGRAWDDAARLLAPILGDAGFEALRSRALYLAQREFPPDRAAERTAAEKLPVDMGTWLQQFEPSMAIEAASTMFSAFGNLLQNLIGDRLTMRLLRKAWPEGFPPPESKETRR